MPNTLMITAWVAAILTLGFSGFLIYEFMVDFDSPDAYTYSNYSSITTDHYDLRLELDFDNKVIVGEQHLKMRTLSNFVMEAILDIRGLEIFEVLYNDTPINFKIVNTKPEVGQALKIRLPFSIKNNEFDLTVKYKTSSDAVALSWLDKSQTQGEKLPYLFTNCETIHCRSIAPFQDTPQVKSTFSVLIISPKDIITRATGNITQEFAYDNHRSTKFESTIPIPSYLFSFVAGDLVEQKISERTYIIAEKAMLSDAVGSLTNIAAALNTLETYLTPYIWGDYKVVVQPPSFPHEGMENPLLSFASSTVIQGDASSADDIIHEMAHSWAGNLVTQDKWTEVWLKEALATFLERKVNKILNGETAYKNSAQRGKISMAEKIAELGETNELTSLHPDSSIVKNPDNILSPIQGEKGFQMLVHMENLIGENFFKDFLVQYFNKFAFKSIDSQDFTDFFVNFIYTVFDSQTAIGIYEQVNFKEWIENTGFPPVNIDFRTPEYISAIAMAEEYIIKEGTATPNNYKDWKLYSVDLKYMFLEHFLQDTSKLNKKLVSRIDSNHKLYYLTNPGLISLFMQIAIAGDYYESPFRYPSEFVGIVGNYELIAPIYAHMAAKNQIAAQTIYQTYENFYALTIRDKLREIVGL